MAGSLYEEEVLIVHRAIALLRSEVDQSLIRDLETEQSAASTGLNGMASQVVFSSTFLRRVGSPPKHGRL